ncbi:hypothetical protein IID04_07210, partial [PVC group bacterium]|nr:hypothetical protein [PVC group bacterium]
MQKKHKWIVGCVLVLFGIGVVFTVTRSRQGPPDVEREQLLKTSQTKQAGEEDESKVPSQSQGMRKDMIPTPPQPVSEKDLKTPPLPPDLKIPDLTQLEPEDVTPDLESYEAPDQLAFKQPAPPRGQKESRPKAGGPMPPEKALDMPLKGLEPKEPVSTTLASGVPELGSQAADVNIQKDFESIP